MSGRRLVEISEDNVGPVRGIDMMKASSTSDHLVLSTSFLPTSKFIIKLPALESAFSTCSVHSCSLSSSCRNSQKELHQIVTMEAALGMKVLASGKNGLSSVHKIGQSGAQSTLQPTAWRIWRNAR